MALIKDKIKKNNNLFSQLCIWGNKKPAIYDCIHWTMKIYWHIKL